MNGLDKITRRIADEAEAACAAAAEDAAKCRAAIEAEYEKKAQAAYDEAVRNGQKETDEQLLRRERTVRLDMKKELLGLKQELVNTAFLMAREKLLRMPREEYIAFLSRLAAEASEQGNEEVLFSPEEAPELGARVVESANKALAAAGKNAALTLSGETRAMAGGLVLRAGDIEINCSLDALLDMSREELAAQIAGILFE